MPTRSFSLKDDLGLVTSLSDNFEKDLNALHSLDRKLFISASLTSGSWLALYFPVPAATLMLVAGGCSVKWYTVDRPKLAPAYQESLQTVLDHYEWIMKSASAQDLAHPDMVKFMTMVGPHLPAELIKKYWTDALLDAVKVQRAGVKTTVDVGYLGRATNYFGSFFTTPAVQETPAIPNDPYIEQMKTLRDGEHERTMEYCLYGQTGELLNHALLHKYSLDTFLRKAVGAYHVIESAMPSFGSDAPKV